MPTRNHDPPAHDPRSSVHRKNEPVRPAGHPIRVLIVDDDVDGAETLATYFQLMGWATRIAHDGEHAIRAADEFEPEAVILDVGLPKHDGYEVARALRTRAWCSETLICAVTAWARPALASVAGLDHYFVKPVDPRILMELIREAHGE